MAVVRRLGKFGSVLSRTVYGHCVRKKTVSVLSAHGGLIALSFEVFITVQYIYVTRSRDHKNPNELYNHNMVVFKTHRDLRKWPTFCRRHFQKHFFLNIFFLLLIQIPLRFVHMAPIGNNWELVQAHVQAIAWSNDSLAHMCINRL